MSLIIGVFGCAGGKLTGVNPITQGDPLPKDLPVEFQEKFEIREVAEPPKEIFITQSGFNPIPQYPSHLDNPPTLINRAKGTNDKNGKRKREALIEEPSVSQPSSQSSSQISPQHSGQQILEPPFVFPNRRPPKEPIWLNEQQVLEVTYFGIVAGDFVLEALPLKSINSRKVYHIRGVAESSSLFSVFYRLKDTVETYIDYEGFFSHRFHIMLDESKQKRDALELNDSEKKISFYWNRWNHRDNGYQETKQTVPIEPFSQDSLSGLYYLRSVSLDPGAVIVFPVINEGKSWEAVVSVIRREMVDTPLGRVRCVVLKPETRYQGVLQKRGDSFLWFTDDDRRFLVRIEAKVKIGTVVGKLKKVVLGEPPS